MLFVIETFNWDKHEHSKTGGTKTERNPKIKNQTNTTWCYSHEHYAQDFWDKLTKENLIKKDLKVGDLVKIVNIIDYNNGVAKLELHGGLVVDIDFKKEKKFISLFSCSNIEDFSRIINNNEAKENLLSKNFFVSILQSAPTYKISLWRGYVQKTRDEFMEQIKTPTKAYVAKIVNANRGGYTVDIYGIEGFMPGSLAAPNKLNDFTSMIGKDVIVMIEDYMKDLNSFIVSHKKYLANILPQKMKELDLEKKYTGTVTGTSNYGIFIEFNELFTGLLHTSKMSQITKTAFINRDYKPGDSIDFYIDEITDDNRIILSEELN